MGYGKLKNITVFSSIQPTSLRDTFTTLAIIYVAVYKVLNVPESWSMVASTTLWAEVILVLYNLTAEFAY